MLEYEWVEFFNQIVTNMQNKYKYEGCSKSKDNSYNKICGTCLIFRIMLFLGFSLHFNSVLYYIYW